MKYSTILLIATLLSVALGQGCNVLPQVCQGLNCPASVIFSANGFNYAPSDFNLISLGSVTIDSGDVQGRVAVRNDFIATKGGVSVGDSLPSSSSPSYSLVAGRNVNWVNGQSYPTNAGIYVGGNFSGSDSLKSSVTGPCPSAGCLDSQFDTLSQYFQQLSSVLAAATNTAAASLVYQELYVNCTGTASVYFVSVDASVFSQATTFSSHGCDASAVFVMNIIGSGSVTFQGRFDSYAAVFNVPSATSVSANTFVYGDIIAPYANLNQISGTVAGLVVAQNASILVQVNLPSCGNSSSTTGSTANSTASVTTSVGVPSATSTSTSGAPSASSTSTSGVPSASSTSTSGVPSGSSTTGPSGPQVNCTFLDNQASCANVQVTLGSQGYTFIFQDYDVIVFGDLSANSGDIEGRTFASGNVNFGNGMFSLGENVRSGASGELTLIAGGLNFTSGSIKNGNAFVAGQASVASYLQSQVNGSCTGCLDAITTAGQTCYNAISSTFGTRSNVQLSMNGNQATVTCNSATDSIYYVNVNSTMINAATFGSFSGCNSGATFVLNIGGSDDFNFAGATFNSQNIIYNIQGARSITISTQINGAILAPQSTVTMTSGVIVGKLVAARATVVQVNVPNCIDSSATSNNANSGANTDASAGINLTPSIMVMVVAMLLSKMF